MNRTKRLELFMRGAVARLGGWLAGGRRPRPALYDGVRRILIIRIDERVGNVLLTTPLISHLRAAIPWAEVDMLVSAGKARILDGLVTVIPFHKRDFFRRPWSFVRRMLELRRRRYDVVIDASHWHTFSTSSALLLAWTGGAIRIAHDRGEARRYATDLVENPRDGEQESEVRTKLRLLTPLQVSIEDAPRMATTLGTSPEAAKRMGAWLSTAASGPAVGLIPGSRKVDHRAGEEVFVRIGRQIRAIGATPVVLWGPGEEGLAQRVASACEGILAPDTDLDELAALMRACAAVVTNDTGPMHLSVATGTPTVSLFVKPDHWRWGHADPPHAVVPGHDGDVDRIVEAATASVRGILDGPGGSDASPG